MKEISEAEMLEALKVAHTEIKKHCKAQMELMEMVGKTTKMTYCHEVNDEELRAQIKTSTYKKVYDVAKSQLGKKDRLAAFEAIRNEIIENTPEEERETKTPLIKRYFGAIEKEAMRDMILNESVRLDGRKTDEIRPIACEVDYLPTAHGSALFTRGETQSLTTVTLGTKLDEKVID